MNKKQLAVLLSAATWVSAVAIYEINYGWDDWRMFAPIIEKSIPALVFGAVLYLWFGRKNGG